MIEATNRRRAEVALSMPIWRTPLTRLIARTEPVL